MVPLFLTSPLQKTHLSFSFLFSFYILYYITHRTFFLPVSVQRKGVSISSSETLTRTLFYFTFLLFLLYFKWISGRDSLYIRFRYWGIKECFAVPFFRYWERSAATYRNCINALPRYIMPVMFENCFVWMTSFTMKTFLSLTLFLLQTLLRFIKEIPLRYLLSSPVMQ